MRLVILAAGRGSRMGTITEDRNKCLLEFGGKTLIERVVEVFEENTIGEVAACVGYMAESVIKIVNRRLSGWCKPVTYYLNPLWHKTGAAYSLLCAKNFWLGHETIIMEGDILFHPDILGDLIDCGFPNCVPVDTRMYPAFGEETLAVMHGNMVAGMVWPASQMTIGEAVVMVKISAYRTQALCQQLPYSNEIIRPLVESGSFHFHPVEQPWIQIDTPEDLDKARALYQEHEEDFK